MELFMLIVMLTVILGGGYQRHRARTPIYMQVVRDGDLVRLNLKRRFGYQWPSNICDDLEFGSNYSYYQNFSGRSIESPRNEQTELRLARFVAGDDETDEKMIEAVVTTKAAIKKWNEQRHSAKKLDNQMRKALKR